MAKDPTVAERQAAALRQNLLRRKEKQRAATPKKPQTSSTAPCPEHPEIITSQENNAKR